MKQVKIPNDLTQKSREKNREEKLISDVELLLTTLVYQEEAIIKAILDCLYDVGSTNLVNQKFKLGTLNKTLKFITKMSKPAFKLLAWQWFKKNCPNLITQWLQSKVAFPRVENPQIEVVGENENPSLVYAPPYPEQNQIQQVKRLHSQVKLLISLLVTVVTMFSGSLIWLGYSSQQAHLQTVEKLQNQVKALESITGDR
ncbi:MULTISPECIES: hypothetical protein [unclassified Anabaena]|uniref:hypothetical protein n=1 Tax=unclassified Anabaena TaxID=2619674 RepID=UPI001445E90F|nr:MULTISPECIES: hypothetical protein [unclassified Anabaena]MTJ07309.1 hypothetical protein [Anabaena sp. UHCC 0204]MTJ55144.1 hypothetical protein [Anabaena sp. UHCC 0253]